MSELLTVMPLPLLVIIGILLLISVIMIGYSYLKDKTLDNLRVDVYELFLTAEHAYKGSSAGKQKMKWVLSQARLLLPNWMQALISEEMLAKLVQIWFNQIKDLLDDGKVNNTVK